MREQGYVCVILPRVQKHLVEYKREAGSRFCSPPVSTPFWALSDHRSGWHVGRFGLWRLDFGVRSDYFPFTPSHGAIGWLCISFTLLIPVFVSIVSNRNYIQLYRWFMCFCFIKLSFCKQKFTPWNLELGHMLRCTWWVEAEKTINMNILIIGIKKTYWNVNTRITINLVVINTTFCGRVQSGIGYNKMKTRIWVIKCKSLISCLTFIQTPLTGQREWLIPEIRGKITWSRTAIDRGMTEWHNHRKQLWENWEKTILWFNK